MSVLTILTFQGHKLSLSFGSVLHLYRETYCNMPQPLKTFLGSIYGAIPLSMRYGKLFNEYTDRFKKFEESDEQYRQDFVYHKTLETLIFAEKNIPFYKEHFQKYGVTARDYKALDDLKRFPSISKEDIKVNLDRMYSRKVEKPGARFSGGSLSVPTKFFYPLYSSHIKQKACAMYTLAKAGYKYRDKTLILKERDVSDVQEDTYWKYEPADNYLYLSSNYLNSDKFLLMHTQAKKFNPKFLFGYPSTVLSFIAMSKQFGLEALKIKGVVVSSESIYNVDLQIIKDFFGHDITVLSEYTHSERVVSAYRLDFENYRFNNAYGLSRVVDDEIVGTSFDNFVMPLINYKTTDEALGDVVCFEGTDIAKEVKNIKGRHEAYLVTADERLISVTTMVGGQHLPYDMIKNMQYRQTQPGKVTVIIESSTEDIDKDYVIRGMIKLVHDGIDFDVEIVDKFDRSVDDKHFICRQFLDIEKIRNKK